MCFSAPASFISSGGLILLGGASLAIAKKEDKLLAAVPLMFGIQQALEGVQWLYLNTGSSSLPAAYGYLFFAFIFWPVYVPVFMYIIDPKKRATLKYFIGLGALVALYFALILFAETLHVRELKSCVIYNFSGPISHFATLAYLITVLIPLFISSFKNLRIIGFVTAISVAVTWIFFSFAFASVWCFFSAIISALFFVHILRRKS